MTTEIAASDVWEINDQILQCNYNIKANFLKMAELLIKMRDGKLYRFLDHNTFESYLGTLGHERTRSWLYKLMRVYETFSGKLALPDKTLLAIGPTKLDIIYPMVPAMMLEERHKEDWLGKAANLSKSDLINEVRQSQGKSLLSSLPAERQIYLGLSDLLLKYKSYTEYVKDSPCMVCGARPVDAHHFPMTKGAGTETEYVVPLCRECHAGWHLNPLKWMHDYKRQWGGYFYGLILRIWEKA